MKFENPIMNISMFEVESVVTGSGSTPAGPKNADAAVADFAAAHSVGTTISFTE